MPRDERGLGLCLCGCGGRPPIATRNDKSKGYVKGQPMRFVRGHGHVRHVRHVDNVLPQFARDAIAIAEADAAMRRACRLQRLEADPHVQVYREERMRRADSSAAVLLESRAAFREAMVAEERRRKGGRPAKRRLPVWERGCA